MNDTYNDVKIKLLGISISSVYLKLRVSQKYKSLYFNINSKGVYGIGSEY